MRINPSIPSGGSSSIHKSIEPRTEPEGALCAVDGAGIDDFFFLLLFLIVIIIVRFVGGLPEVERKRKGGCETLELFD